MLFTRQSLLFGAATLLANLARADDCGSGPWDPSRITIAGGNTGGPWCATKWNQGMIINGVDIWTPNHDPEQIDSLRWKYSDDTYSPIIGKTDTSAATLKSVTWDATDLITNVQTWGNWNGGRLGRLLIETKSGKKVDGGIDSGKISSTQYTHDVQSGILLAAWGHNGGSIDKLGLNFLKSPVKTMQQTQLKFKDTPDELNKRKQGIQWFALDRVDSKTSGINGTGYVNTVKTFDQRKRKAYTHTGTNTFGLKLSYEVSGELMGIGAKADNEFSYSYAHTDSSEESTDSAITLSYTVNQPVPQDSHVWCEGSIQSGMYSGKYDCVIVLGLADGTTWSYASEGQMQQITWGEVHNECQPKPFTDTLEMLPESPAPLSDKDANVNNNSQKMGIKFRA